MNILVISQRKVLPMRDGALIYTMGLIKLLHKIGADVTLISFTDGDEYTKDERDELAKYVSAVYLCPLFWKNTALNVSLRYPNNIRKYTRNSMFSMIKKIINNNKFDTVIIDHLQMFEYSKLFHNGEKIVLHTHNVESKIWYEYAKKCNGLVKLLVQRSAKMTYSYEKYAIRKADIVTAISESDCSAFKKMGGEDKVFVLNGYSEFPVIKSEEDIHKISKKLLFIGSYGWYPNVESAMFLMNELMPRLRKMGLNCKLLLVGKNPTQEMISCAKKWDDIEITGMVDSVDPYIKECDIFVNPVCEGSGINIKIAEALGKGIPVVSSEFGVRGYSVTNGVECLIYKNIDECCEQIKTLFENRTFAAEIAKNAREFYLKFNTPSKEIMIIFC